MMTMRAMVSLALAMTAFAQEPTPVFRSRVEAVRIDVSVMSGTAPVPGLTAAHFALTDNGVAQVIDRVSVDTVPLSIMLVLDTSGSLSGAPLGHLIDAAQGLVRSLAAADRAALITFAEPVRLVVPMTADRQTLLTALSSLKADGSTSLNDAVFLALQLRPPEVAGSRPVVVVFSDGEDTASWLSNAKIVEATRRSGVVTHAVELMPERWTGSVRGGTVARPSVFLRDLTAAGGGRRWSAQSSRDLRALFATALDELRSRYLLTYSPQGVAREGWHDVKVRLKGTRGDVTARPGYFVAR
jgi:Ca-activated chloride channel homolog